jgi:uncharacterized protein (DUF433 family)
MTEGRIASDPGVLSGKPVVRGTRVSVALILDLLGSGWSVDDLLAEYASLEREDVMAALKYAAEVLSDARPAAAE